MTRALRVRRATPGPLRAALISASIVCASPWPAMPAHAANVRASNIAQSEVAPLQPLQPLQPIPARLYATARAWANKHRDDLALQAIDKALLIAPDEPRLLAERVRIQLRLGQAQQAAATLARMKTAAPDALLTRQVDDEYRVAVSGRQEMAAVRLLFRSGQSEEAARRVSALFPHGAPSGALGAEYYQIIAATPARRNEALNALHRRVAADPDDIDAALTLARLLNASDATRAEANRIAWNLAARTDADRGTALDLWRRVLQAAGADTAYLPALRAYLALVPDDSELSDRVALLDARVEAQKKLARDPDYIAQQRGLAALAHGDVATASPLLARAAAARPTDAEAVGGLGMARMREGQRDEARALFERAAALAPDNRAKWQGLARTAQFWGTLAHARDAANAAKPADAERFAREALAMQPGNADAQLLLADALLAQRNWRAAEPMLRAQLAGPAPSLSALRSTRTLLESTGRANEVEPLIEALQSRFTAADDRESLVAMRADLVAAKAQQLADSGRNGPAAQAYEASLRIDPNQPWTRFALARLYQNLGLPQLGRAVMDDGLARTPNAQMRYASALYRNSTDDLAGAQAALGSVPDAERTDAMRALARNLNAQQALRDARAAYARNDAAAAQAALDRAQSDATDDADMLASIGALYIDHGDAARGLALLRDWMAAHPEKTDADVRLRYGDLLGAARRETELAGVLAQLRGDDALTPRQRERLEDQSLRGVLRRADDAIAAADYARARALLATVSEAGRRDKRYAFEVADLARVQGDYATARAALAPVLAASPDDFETQLTLARVLGDSGKRRDALAIVQRVVDTAPPDDIDTRLSAARRLSALRRPRDAQHITEPLRVAYPARPDVTLQAGRVAEDLGDYADAASLYRLSMDQERAAGVAPAFSAPAGAIRPTPAQSAFDDLNQRRNPEVETAWIPAYKSGDAGVSEYHAQQVPIYVQIPYRYDGHFFIHADAVHLDAGTLDDNGFFNPSNVAAGQTPSSVVSQFGTTAGFYDSANTTALQNHLASAPVTPGDLHQHANGLGGGFGYVSDAWRFDLGSTPIGFPVHYLVGGARYRFDAGPASLSVSASRRAVTSSELSYAGLADPLTHTVWGGVRRDGIDVHVGADFGRIETFADIGVAELSGRNVAGNQEFTLRTGFNVPVYERATMRVLTGLVGNAWHYTENLRYYTFGQGGYYSPQRYLSLGVPLEFMGKRNGFMWDVTATAGVSNAYEKDSPYFPNGLPAVAGLSAADLSQLKFSGSSTRGVSFSYGLAATVEYRMSPQLAVGARVSIDHSHDYAPSSGMVYARFAFSARKDDYRISPQPVRLYSSY
ncbi:cellulose synthase subunit BcsC-related outer membrane protein [Caballeronia concitans]|uniref:Cellulose synthase domain-containing protein n=1 Tax=Caballeronia concitans TaxID=1777133 RepID=A0A658QTD4_9BURK|nr:cellulose synthase subunit BcsC-related outer membrane protein [Caballeronia concitans]SAL19686.1 cellulose synthase domain-containing protein [Caballeronia concitans]